MTLTIDIGNTRRKWAIFDGAQMLNCGYWEASDTLPWKDYEIDETIGCCVGDKESTLQILKNYKIEWLHSDSFDHLPIKINYNSPKTLGVDRVAAACGAWKFSKGKGCVIIDAGTCITIDYLDQNGAYQGGAILPGVHMQLKALHQETAKLPMITTDLKNIPSPCGKDTQQSMLAGTQTATSFAIAGFVRHYLELSPNAEIWVTGGNSTWVEMLLKDNANVHVEQNLVMIGMNEIAMNKKLKR